MTIPEDSIGVVQAHLVEPGSERRSPRPTLVVQARGETFRVVQLEGQLFVCSRDHGSCCCGRGENGHATYDQSVWTEEWVRRRLRNRVQLTFTGCLGTCAIGNSGALFILGTTLGLKDLNDVRVVPKVWDYIESILAAGEVVDPPAELSAYVYQRFTLVGGASR